MNPDFGEKLAETESRRQQREGELLKFTNMVKGWQTRWFVIDFEAGVLHYYEKEEQKTLRPKGSVCLTASVVTCSVDDEQTFSVVAMNGETLKLRAVDSTDRQQWVNILRCAAKSATSKIVQGSIKKDIWGQACCEYLLPARLDLSHKVRQIPKGDKQGSNCHCSELLEYVAEAHHFARKMNAKIATLSYSGYDDFMTPLDRGLLKLKAVSAMTLRCLQQCKIMLQSMGLHTAKLHITESEMTQMSDSRTLQPISSLPRCCVSTSAKENSKFDAVQMPVPVPSPHENIRNTLDKSRYTILQMLSSLKTGMDLTKTVLPTFLLEPQSLLESFADTMGHPNLFLSIADKVNPTQRFMAVLEWYITSFHTVIPDAIVKKPYNPVLGETFHCSWLVPHQTGRAKSSKTALLAAGPAKYDSTTPAQLIYCAEQVSHHPPVSAFYYECPEKKMCMNGSILVKCKLLGMSVGVTLEGKVKLNVLDHNEEYVFRLPCLYVRSIVTVPWVELVDKVSLTCRKTNLSAAVTFHAKPFYEGQINRVSAEVKNTQSGSCVCRVSGQWNSVLEVSYIQNGHQTKMVNITQLKVWQKRVRPIPDQDLTESRRLWQHVTNSLIVGDVGVASEHKRLVEERHREKQKHLKKMGAHIPAKYFKLVEDTWMFIKPLSTATCASVSPSLLAVSKCFSCK